MTREMDGDFAEQPVEYRFDRRDVSPAEVVHFQSFGACRAAARLLPWDNEGYVVADMAGNRIKVKSEAYMAMQRLISGDSENARNDALAVALTLHRAQSPLASSVASIVTS